VYTWVKVVKGGNSCSVAIGNKYSGNMSVSGCVRVSNRQWAVGSGQWAVGSGQWQCYTCQWQRGGGSVEGDISISGGE
jgi:hypothetical protein